MATRVYTDAYTPNNNDFFMIVDCSGAKVYKIENLNTIY